MVVMSMGIIVKRKSVDMHEDADEDTDKDERMA